MELKLCNERSTLHLGKSAYNSQHSSELQRKEMYWSIIDSGIQQSDSVYIYIYIYFKILFRYKLL